MAWNFTTTTIVNTPYDTTGKDMFFFDDKKKALIVKRVGTFYKENTVWIYKTAYKDPQFAKATLDLSTAPLAAGLTEGVFRLNINLRALDADALYANPYATNTRPFHLEFTRKQGEDDATVVKKIVALAKKTMNFLYEKEVMNVTADGGKVVLTVTDANLNFAKADIEFFNEKAAFNPVGGLNMGVFEPVASAKLYSDSEYDQKNKIERGFPGFGTYSHLLKDYRLPSHAHNGVATRNSDETPVLGGKYNQYILVMEADRGVMGTDAVGDMVVSRTQHVFWVKEDVVPTFEENFKKILRKGDTDFQKVPQ